MRPYTKGHIVIVHTFYQCCVGGRRGPSRVWLCSSANSLPDTAIVALLGPASRHVPRRPASACPCDVRGRQGIGSIPSRTDPGIQTGRPTIGADGKSAPDLQGCECLDHIHSRIGCTFLEGKRSGWTRNLSVRAEGKGLVGHAGAVPVCRPHRVDRRVRGGVLDRTRPGVVGPGCGPCRGGGVDRAGR